MGATNQNRSYERSSRRRRNWPLRWANSGQSPIRTLTASLAVVITTGIVTACSTTRPQDRPTVGTGTTTACPGPGDIAKALSAQSSYWRRSDSVISGTITCAGAYVTAGVRSAPQSFHVLLKHKASGLRLLRTGTGPICSIFPSDANGAMVVVPKQYGRVLHCLTSH